MDYDKAFETLTPQEFAVIYWKSQGLTHTQVGDVLGWGIDNVQRINSTAHKKLGLGELLQKRREPILQDEIYPALREWIKHHTEVLDRLRPPLDPLLNPGVVPEKRRIQTVQDFSNQEDWTASDEHEGPEVVEGEEVDENEYERQRQERARPRSERAEQGSVRRSLPGIRAVVTGVLLVGGLCISLLWLGRNGLFAILSPTPTRLVVTDSAPTSAQTLSDPVSLTPSSLPAALQTSNARKTQQALESPTPHPTNTPENTATSEILPTPAPFPGMESFSNPLSDLWEVSGDPYIATGRNVAGRMFGKSLTAKDGEVVTITTGNNGWTDYVINLQANAEITDMELTVGVRVQDQNNMVMLKCKYVNCNWVVLSEGRENILLENQTVWWNLGATIRVDGTDFIASYTDFELRETSVSLPEKYQKKFKNGGVLIRYKNTEFEYIEIQPE